MVALPLAAGFTVLLVVTVCEKPFYWLVVALLVPSATGTSCWVRSIAGNFGVQAVPFRSTKGGQTLFCRLGPHFTDRPCPAVQCMQAGGWYRVSLGLPVLW